MDDVTYAPELVSAVAPLLRSLGLQDSAEVERLAKAIAPSPVAGDAEMTRNVAVTRLGEWFARCLARTDLPPEQAFLAGRAAFVAVAAADRWPGVLLSDTPPADFVRALAAQIVEPCPAAVPAAMPAQSLTGPGLLAPLAGWLRLPSSRRTGAA